MPDSAGISGAGAKSSAIAGTTGSSAKYNAFATSRNKYTNASMAEEYNAKPSAYDHYNNSSSSSSVIKLDYSDHPTSSYTTSLPTATSSSASRTTTSKPIDIDASTKQALIYRANNSDNDSDDEDYQRAIAESMLDPVIIERPTTTSSDSHSNNKPTIPSNTSATATLYDTTPAMDTSLDDVIYVETPHKATSSQSIASTTRIIDYRANSQATPSNSQKSPRMYGSTAPKKIITVIDESQEDSQDITFCSPVKSTAQDTSRDTTGKVSNSVATGYSSKKNSDKDVVVVDTPPSVNSGNKNNNDNTITKDSTSNTHTNTNYTPLPTATANATKPVVYELDDSQNDISITMDTMDTMDTMPADSPDVVVLPVPTSAVRSAVKVKSSTSGDTPEVRTTHGKDDVNCVFLCICSS